MDLCQSVHYNKLPFKYFVILILILRLLSKVSYTQTTVSRGPPEHYSVKVEHLYE